jgi:hypothetical protein
VQRQRLKRVHRGVEIRCRIARPPRAWRRCELPVRPLQSGATGRNAEKLGARYVGQRKPLRMERARAEG